MAFPYNPSLIPVEILLNLFIVPTQTLLNPVLDSCCLIFARGPASQRRRDPWMQRPEPWSLGFRVFGVMGWRVLGVMGFRVLGFRV